MYTTARITEIKDSQTVLLSCSSSACNACKAQMFCNNKNVTSFLAKKTPDILLEVGDTVQVYLPPGKTVISTVLIFSVPLVFFLVAYLITKNFFSVNELLCALIGFGAMALSFLLAYFVSFKHKRSLMPVVMGRVAQLG